MATEIEKAAPELQELVAQSDTGARKPAGATATVIFAVSLAWALFQLWYASPLPFALRVGVLNDTEARSLHLAFALCLLYLIMPTRPRAGTIDLALRCVAAALSVVVTVYAAVEFTNPGIFRAIDPTRLDILFGTILVVLLLEATRRVAGLASAVLLAAVYVGNLKMAVDASKSDNTGFKVAAYGRLPLQFPLIRGAWRTWKG